MKLRYLMTRKVCNRKQLRRIRLRRGGIVHLLQIMSSFPRRSVTPLLRHIPDNWSVKKVTCCVCHVWHCMPNHKWTSPQLTPLSTDLPTYGHFSVESKLASSPWVFVLSLFWRRTLGDKQHKFFNFLVVRLFTQLAVSQH